jgi:hypothetical protein
MKRFATAIALTMALYLVAVTPVAAQSSQKTKYLAYLTNEYAAVQVEMKVYDAIMADLDAEDYYAAINDLGVFQALGARQVKWLNSHQPAACYKKAWALSRNEWTQFREAGRQGVIALRDTDFDALDDMKFHVDKGVNYQTAAATAMQKANCP